MYPPKFDYLAPTTLEQALSIPLMKLRFAAPPALVDINRLPDLDFLD